MPETNDWDPVGTSSHDEANGQAESGDRPVPRNLEALLDVEIPVAAEVGTARLSLQSILELGPGTVILLDKRLDEALDLRVNGKLVARGEIVSADGSYALRITEIVGTGDRLETLR
jgi:flagellar motor switch protein FliN/FliY